MWKFYVNDVVKEKIRVQSVQSVFHLIPKAHLCALKSHM